MAFDWSAAAGWSSTVALAVGAGVRTLVTRIHQARTLEDRIAELERAEDRNRTVQAILVRAHSRALLGLQAGRSAEETLQDLMASHRQAVGELAQLDV